jgi:predicted permease
MLPDLRFAFRTLSRTPVVTLVAILSLALGIGANTSIFSIMDQILLRGLPVPERTQLVNITANGQRAGMNSNNTSGPGDSIFSYPMFRDLEQKQTVFTAMGGHRHVGANVAYGKQTFSGGVTEVSGGYFPALQLNAVRGRLIGPQDDRNRNGHPVAVLSYNGWQKRFNGAEGVLNQTVLINGTPMTVIGIAPAGFSGTTLGQNPDFFTPLSMHELVVPGTKWLDNRRAYWLYSFARVKPGLTRAQAEGAMNSLYRGIINEVDAPLQKGASENFMKRFRAQQMTLKPGELGQSFLHQNASAPLFLLMGITGFVLLIACANIANLLLARAASRQREMSVRLSVGASRGQLIRQLLVESLVIAVAGGVTGLVVAYATSRLLLSYVPGNGDIMLSPDLDPRAMLFALGLAVCTGLLFGLFPALHSTKQDLVTALKDQAGGVSASGSAGRFRKTLVVAQIALSLLLLISAGLFLKSLVAVSRVQLGVRTENVIGFGLSPELSKYTAQQSRVLFQKLEENLAAVPGVTAASVARVPLLAGSNWGNDVSVDGFERGPDTDANSRFNEVGPDYFRLFGIRMVAGRTFTAADATNAPKVAVVNEAFVRKFSPKSGIVGKRMQIGNGGKNDIEIVGVAVDTKYSEVKDAVPPLHFLPYRQAKEYGSSHIYVATRLPAEQMVASVRRVVGELDPNLPMENLMTMQQQVRENVFLDRMISSFASAFAGLATVLAAIGLYGVLAFNVARRTREIGIRMAIGAQAPEVRNMVMREVGVMIAIGVVIALPAAWALAKYTESLLFEMKGRDPLVWVVATVAVVLVSLAAGYLPARRAMRTDPLVALRYE